jgi:16S rRNA (cytosine967-C5)-methyltransferase
MWPGALEVRLKDQTAVLDRAASMAKPGGRIAYITCSVLPAENEAVTAQFLDAHRRDAQGVPATLASQVPGAEVMQNGVQLLPGAEAGTDGFHYACVEKTTRTGAHGT